MKKGISILLLFCFTLYHFGYYVFYFSYQYKIEADWTAKIHDENSKLQKVMEIPMRLPYLVDQEDFQNTNIVFKKDGKSYRGIKKRFTNDAFQLVYVPDIAKIKLDLNLKQWVISVSSDGSSENNGDQILAKILVKDYTRSIIDYSFHSTFHNLDKSFGFVFLPFENQVTNLNTPPPELFS